MVFSVSVRVENIVRKGEKDDYQHFLLFPQCFLKALSFKVIKIRDCSFNEPEKKACENIVGKGESAT